MRCQGQSTRAIRPGLLEKSGGPPSHGEDDPLVLVGPDPWRRTRRLWSRTCSINRFGAVEDQLCRQQRGHRLVSVTMAKTVGHYPARRHDYLSMAWPDPLLPGNHHSCVSARTGGPEVKTECADLKVQAAARPSLGPPRELLMRTTSTWSWGIPLLFLAGCLLGAAEHWLPITA